MSSQTHIRINNSQIKKKMSFSFDMMRATLCQVMKTNPAFIKAETPK